MSVSTVAIITGASKGLGRAITLGLLGGDAHVVAISRTHDAQLARHAVENGYTLQQIQCDLANPTAVQRLSEPFMPSLPADAKRYVLINNAGAVNPIGKTDALHSAAAITAAFALNVTSVMALTAAFLRRTADMGVERRILNISSGAGRSAVPGWGVYCATKAALDRYSEVVAAEQHAHTRIASLAPGVIDTDMQQTIRDSESTNFPNVEKFRSLYAQGQLSSPVDTAARILTYLNRDDFGATVLDDIRQYA
jgi:benzil reductase ((S)-benzoin forming)